MNIEPLKLDTLVELQDQYSNVYPLSPTGARGWVRARREMPKVDPEVYIEWDKAHWRYHGEHDGWTFEHHFRPVDDTLPDPHQPEGLSMEKILETARQRLEDERCPHCGEFHDEDEDAFLAALADAQEEALKSEAFFILTIRPQEKDGMVYYEPKIHTQSLTSLAQEMVRVQLVHLATQIFENHVLDQVQILEKRPNEPGR